MLSCHEATQLMSQELDRSLSWYERALLRLHVSICRACGNYRRHMGVLREACKRYQDHRFGRGDD